jgi:hypothetical protein
MRFDKSKNCWILFSSWSERFDKASTRRREDKPTFDFLANQPEKSM